MQESWSPVCFYWVVSRRATNCKTSQQNALLSQPGNRLTEIRLDKSAIGSVWLGLLAGVEQAVAQGGRMPIQMSMQGGENRSLHSHFSMAYLPIVRMKVSEN